MSFVTGTAMELLYASTSAGAAKPSFTTEIGINDTATMGVQAHIPADFWLPSPGQSGRGIRIQARGIVSANTAAPTFTWTIRGGAAGNVASTPILLGSAALGLTASTANAYWELQGDIIMKTMGAAGGNSTCTCVGFINCGAFSGAITSGGDMYGAWGAAASPGTVATVDTSIVNYINFNVACSANAVANTIQLQQLLVFGLN